MKTKTKDSETVLKAFPRKDNEEIRIIVSTYKGTQYLHLRTWYSGKDDDGVTVWKPTKQGVSFVAEEVLDVRKALRKAQGMMEEAEAVEHGDSE